MDCRDDTLFSPPDSSLRAQVFIVRIAFHAVVTTDMRAPESKLRVKCRVRGVRRFLQSQSPGTVLSGRQHPASILPADHFKTSVKINLFRLQ